MVRVHSGLPFFHRDSWNHQIQPMFPRTQFTSPGFNIAFIT
jgi:hypothetical protein